MRAKGLGSSAAARPRAAGVAAFSARSAAGARGRRSGEAEVESFPSRRLPSPTRMGTPSAALDRGCLLFFQELGAALEDRRRGRQPATLARLNDFAIASMA